MNVHDLVGKTLRDLGVDTVFGVMGEVNMYVMYRFVAEGGKYVKAASEAGATQMALGYSSTSGRVGVATTTCGPGFTNTMTSLIEGVRAHHPMVLLTGQGRDDLRGYMQSVDQRAFAIAAGAGFESPDNMHDVQASLVRAFQRAYSEKRPIVHELPPYNLFAAADIPYRQYTLKLQQTSIALEPGEAWDQAIGIIATARRPIILMGHGAVMEDATQELLALAQRIDAPIMTTLRAKDHVHGAPGYLGLMGISCRTEAIDAILASDCIISFGASLNTYTTGEGAYLNDKRIVCFNNMSLDVGKYVVPDVTLTVGLKSAINYIIHWLDEAEVEGSGFAQEEVVIRAQDAIRLPRTLQNPEFNEPGFLTYDKAMQVIDESLGARILVTEGGRYKYSAWHNIFVDDARDFIPSLSYGCIGIGLGHGVGAALAKPDSTVIIVVGDGGMMNAGMAELQTIQNEQLNVIVVVCNDGAYGAEYHKFIECGRDPDLTLMKQPNFSDIATALRAGSIKVEEVGDLPLLRQKMKDWQGKGLLLIELVVDTRSSE